MDAFIWLYVVAAVVCLTLIGVCWCCLRVSSMESAREEKDCFLDDSIFDEESADCETVISRTVVRVQ